MMVFHHEYIDNDNEIIRFCTELVNVGVMVVCVGKGEKMEFEVLEVSNGQLWYINF